eukprot:603065-Amphidinium_carterae.1
MLGRGKEVLSTTARAFIRVANSRDEVLGAVRLHRALRSALPESRVFLLVIVDMQLNPGPVLMPTVDGVDLLFYKVDQQLFSQPDLHFAAQMETCTEAYAAAVATALRIWASGDVSYAMSICSQASSLEALVADCQRFDAGDPAVALYTPTVHDSVAQTPPQKERSILSDRTHSAPASRRP